MNNPEAGAVYLGTESGICITVDVVTGSATSIFDPRTRLWYELGKLAGGEGPVWTEKRFEDAFGRGLVIACAQAYHDADGNLSGVVGIGFELSSMSELVSRARAGRTGHSFIMDAAGNIIMSSMETDMKTDGNNINKNSDLVMGNLLKSINESLRTTAKKMLSSASGIETVVIDGIEYYIAYNSLYEIPWIFATLISTKEAIHMAAESEANIIELKNEAIKSIDYWVLRLCIIFGIVLLGIVVIIAYVSRHLAVKLTNPITELTQGAKIIGDGNLEYKLDIRTEDEIRTLADTFNKMIHDIKEITAEKERIGAELSVATKIQASMLPNIFPAFPDREEFDVYAKMRPAKEVGGDFFDFFLVSESRLCVVIADVSGKGVPAALFMVIAKTLIKNSALYGNSPSEIFEAVNNLLCEGNDAGMFVTAFVGILDIETGKFTYANAGHNYPLMKKKGGNYEWLTSKPEFVLAAMEDIKYNQYETVLNEDDILFLYTDGVTEAMNKELELFSDKRLEDCLNKCKASVLKDVVDEIELEIDSFAEGTEQADDITILMLMAKKIEACEEDFSELTVTASIDRLDEVLSFIEKEYGVLEPSSKIQTQINTAVEEIFVNIAHYAYAPDAGEATIRAKAEDGIFIVELCDKGRQYNPLLKPEPNITLSAEERDLGGLGIFIMLKFMDEALYRYEDRKNILTLKKRVVPGGSNAKDSSFSC